MTNAPREISAWPFSGERIDRPDGSKGWTGGHWGKGRGAKMPHATTYIRADLVKPDGLIDSGDAVDDFEKGQEQ